MKASLFKKHLFLFLSLFSFLLTLSIWYFFVYNTSHTSDQRSIQSISRKVNAELKLLEEQSKEIRETIEESERPSFSNLLQEKNYPYFIFRNKGLYVWSDNNFSPPYEILKGTFQYKLIPLRNGKYIVHKNIFRLRGDIFEVFTFLPLTNEYAIENTYIKSFLNERIFGTQPYKINSIASKQANNIYTVSGDFLFSLEIPEDYDYKHEGIMLFLSIVSGIGIWLLFLYLFKNVLALKENDRVDLSIVLLLIGLLIIRGGMLILNYPFSFFEFDLFNSKYFASSSISPSLGDVLLNVVSLIIFSWYFFNNYHKTSAFKYLIKAGEKWKVFVSILLVVLSFCFLYFVFYTLGILSFHSQWSLDITVDINFNIFRLISIAIFISTFVIYFIYAHIFFRIFISLNFNKEQKIVILFAIGTILFCLLSYIWMEFHWPILLIHTIYFFILYYLQLPKSVGKLKYSTYLYYLTCALICSATGAYSIYNQHLKKSIFDKQHFATDLVFKNDVFGEYLLNEASSKIRKDIFIQHRLITPLSSKELIQQKIKRIFLANYFDKYEVIVTVFDASGVAYNNESDYSNYFEAQEKYANPKYRTEYSAIYFFTDPESGAVKYICFNEVEMDGVIVGYIIVELKQKKIIPHSVYPELLVDTKKGKSSSSGEYHYGVFSKGKLLYSFGNFNYEKQFLASWLNDEDIHAKGIVDENFHHIAIKGADEKQIVVTSEKYSVKRLFSNFTFLFLILIIFTLVFIVIYAINFRFRKINITYATKIQIYLNIAFFLPLLIVSITTLSIISISYQDNLNNSFIKKAEDISSNISASLQGKKLGEDQRENIENTLLQISKLTQTDINLFNSRGKLIVTNQPMIYDLGFLSKLINPHAFVTLSESMNSTVMVPETIGDLKYNSVYVSIRSIENGSILGILSMPFFESKNELDKQIIEVLTTIVNIFVTIFILFLLLSYFASHVLTVPLKIITQNLKKTTLEKNEPIDWQTHDEIGLLVGEYNRMLVKLEESKEALSRSEKESAWREMAKQVAHEIKNPLTPMKLTIQHLQRALEDGGGKASDLTNKALHVLLDQINNLNEIATSFSLFAKMPIPKNQKFEISSVLAKVAELHNNNKDVDVETSIAQAEYFVMGDEQLMNGIFTNLIINGVQSVPSERRAKIKVNLSSSGSNVLIEIKDNGTGIPSEIRNKVFLPNFSTKFSGSGIGLAVAKRGVEHAGGKIWFETIQGAGTSFFIEIPLID